MNKHQKLIYQCWKLTERANPTKAKPYRLYKKAFMREDIDTLTSLKWFIGQAIKEASMRKNVLNFMNKEYKAEKIDICTFIKNHKHINYCECVIYRDGFVEYAQPSHITTLIRASGTSKEEIDELMPIFASPIDWLVEYTGMCAVYTNCYIAPPKITIAQRISLNKLIEAGLIQDHRLNDTY